MIWIFTGVVAFAYWFLRLLSLVAIHFLDIQTEKKLFWWKPEDAQQFVFTSYIDFEIPEFEQFDFYLSDSPEINAYATLGANIILTSGLLAELENQEELIFVMAHEVAHINWRDVLRSLTIHLPLKIILANLGFDLNIGSISLTQAGILMLGKSTELNADRYAAKLLVKYWLNPACAKPFFERSLNMPNTVMEMLSDHPTNLTRLKLLDEIAAWGHRTWENNCHKLVFKP